MKPFTIQAAPTLEEAVIRSQPEAVHLLAGGTNQIDLMRDYVRQPDRLVDISALPLEGIAARPDGSVRIGALTTNTAMADHPDIASRYTAVSEAILAGASQQIRNRATAAGNMLQSVRCPYFWDTESECNRRERGSGCAALGNPIAYHGVLGVNGRCVAANPSDMSAGLALFDPVVEVVGPGGMRRIAFADFHQRPGRDPSDETTLEAGDVITAIELPPAPAGRSGYLKLRERHSYAYALVSIAAHRGADGRTRLAFGSVGSVPWRARAAEAVLDGGGSVSDAIDAEFGDAWEPEPLRFKRPMIKGGVSELLQRLEA